MAHLWTIAGILAVCGTLREIFRDLFQPSGSGALSSLLGRALFGLGKRIRWLLPIAGPLTVVTGIAAWTALITIGFGLIYWPHFPQDFQQPAPQPLSWSGRVCSVLYFSLVSLTTLASDGLSPRGAWLQICTAVESLIGIGLVTASVTWIVLIYPALGRMRTIARWASILDRAREKPGRNHSLPLDEDLLRDFAHRIVRARIDFIHFPLIYYFHADTEGSSLAHALRGLLEMAREASAEGREEKVRFAAVTLEIALADLAEVLTAKFLPKADPKKPRQVFDAVADDHLQRDEHQSDK
ncbi:MAG TPA: potassium channel family protein [Bryobacteraceae bacterium]|nr:potassium channel family protein [Bryobacteraceae bacterium]